MPRPDFVNFEDISRWSHKVDQDLPEVLAQDPIIREVCYAGLWLVEQLMNLNTPTEYIDSLRFAAGQCSFGRDPWEVHQKFLEDYALNKIEFETGPVVAEELN